MKIISLHVDYIKFKPTKKALKSIEKLKDKEKEEKEVKDCLAILTAVEKNDSKKTVKKLVKEIKKISEQINLENKKIVLYPYAHLSSNLGSPDKATELLEETKKELKKEKFDVVKAPFGYYKQFELKCKGHPLSELSKEIHEEESEEKEISKEEHKDLIKKMSKRKISVKKAPGGKKNNIELGRDLDLYINSEIIGQGLPLFTPKGTAIKREIKRFIEDEELKRGYEYTDTPELAKSDLYKLSGHWQHYRDSMFTMKINKEDYALRPMTCPFQFALFKRKPRSYKDLPKKYSEIATLFRNEQSGELRGLTRVRQFALSDAHILCKPDQLESQFEEVLDLVKYFMNKLGIENIWYRFSKWDPKNKENKYIDNPKAWENSQKTMKKILDKLKLDYIEEEGEAAFYGPKLDLQYKDVYGKEDTLITIQIDFALPERFDINYTDKDHKEKRPMIIHRSSVGCIERTLAHLLEETQGNLPTWLSPIQVRVINFTERNEKSCKKFIDDIKKEIPNIRIDTDFAESTVNSKVRQAEIERIPYTIVIGDKEEKSDSLAVRKESKVKNIKQKEFISNLKKEIENRE